jgi:PKD repeat protein
VAIKSNKMKKIYLSLVSACLTLGLNAQDAFWTTTNYKGAFPVTDNTPATDWTSGWTNFDPQNTAYPSTATLTVSADITASTTWSGVVLLQNKVYVKNNATLTIQPGTIILGDKATQGSLIVTRGAKLNAIGTAAQPIIFTSNQAAGLRLPGDWGGVVVLGLARNNQPGGVANIEGIVPTTDTQYGGAFDTDNSGTIKYVRIEFAGIALEPNKEINGLTFGSVGSGTTVDYVQVTQSGDDSFEWFGGTVNCKHIISYRATDDDFDTDFGFRGKVQFGLIIRDKDLSDAIGDSNGFESDNDAAGSTGQPKTRPVFSNVTLVGAKGNGTVTLPVGEKHERAFRLRRNTATSVFNSIATGFEKGLYCEGAAVVNNLNGDTLVFANNILTNFTNPSWSSNNTNTQVASPATTAWYQSWWGTDNNDSTSTLAQVNWVNIFTAMGTTPDARLGNGSVASSGANFLDPKFFSVVAPTVATNSFTYCQGASASALTATASSGNSLAWYTVATGGTASTSAPTPSTASAGTFTYYVSQKNSAGDESPRVAITVLVNAAPGIPTISANGPLTFCEGFGVTLSAPSATSYAWSNGSTNQSITVTTAGNYTVTVTNSNNCSDISAASIVVVQQNVTPFFSQVSPICSGANLNALPTSSLNSVAGIWSPAIDNTQTTLYTFTPNAGQCATNTNLTITVNANPTAVINYTGALNFCQGGSVDLTSSSTIGNAWSNGGSAQTITVNNSGTYTVTVTNTDGCSDVSNPVTVNVNNSPAPSISASSLQACTGDSITLTSTTADAYVWSNGGTTQSITVNASGNFTVTTTNTNACNGVGTSSPISLTFNTVTPTVTASATQACSGEIVTLTSTAADSYAWSTGATTQTIQVSATGTVTVTTTNSDACAGIGASAPVTVTFTQTPSAQGAYTASGNVATFTNTSTGATSYSWDFGDFSNSSAAAPVHAFASNGDYSVVLTAINGNCTDTTVLTVAITVSVEEMIGFGNINVYPNPASESITVSFDNQLGNSIEISLIDAFGRTVVSETVQSLGLNELGLNLSSISNGMYTLKLTSNNNIVSRKVIVRK